MTETNPYAGIPGAQDAVERAEMKVIPANTVIGWVLTGVDALDVSDPKAPFFSARFEATEPTAFKDRKLMRRYSTSNAKQMSKKNKPFVFWNIALADITKIAAGILFCTPREAQAALFAGLEGLGTPENPLTDHTNQLVKPVIANMKKLCGQGTVYTKMRVGKTASGDEFNEFGKIAYPKDETEKELGVPQSFTPGDTSDEAEFEVDTGSELAGTEELAEGAVAATA